LAINLSLPVSIARAPLPVRLLKAKCFRLYKNISIKI
jgi:hypothetical protein